MQRHRNGRGMGRWKEIPGNEGRLSIVNRLLSVCKQHSSAGHAEVGLYTEDLQISEQNLLHIKPCQQHPFQQGQSNLETDNSRMSKKVDDNCECVKNNECKCV